MGWLTRGRAGGGAKEPEERLPRLVEECLLGPLEEPPKLEERELEEEREEECEEWEECELEL